MHQRPDSDDDLSINRSLWRRPIFCYSAGAVLLVAVIGAYLANAGGSVVRRGR